MHRFAEDGSVIEFDLSVAPNGDIAFVSGLDEIKDRFASAMRLWKGDYPLNISLGLDYDFIFSRTSEEKGLIRGQLIGYMRSISGVTDVDLHSVEIVDNELIWSAIITTEFGQFNA